MRRGRKAFTLIELLVVVGIIALLAAILLPALGRARETAKSVACMSNLHSIGLGLHTYVAAYGNYYPIDYQYNNGEGESPTTGDGFSGGYFHWTAALEPDQYTASVFYVGQNAALAAAGNASNPYGPYPMNEPNYVCPSHVPHGFCPTNFTTTRIPNPAPGQTSETPANPTATPPYMAVDDRQTPRLSYVANEAVMPRKKYCTSHDNEMLAQYAGTDGGSSVCTFANYDNSTYGAGWNNTSNLVQVQEDEITSPATTILMAEFSQNPACIYGKSIGGGNAYKSHRPVNAVKLAALGHMADSTNGVPATDDFRLFDGEEYDTNMNWQFYKLTINDAMADINAVTNGTVAAANLDHITYIDPNAHLTGSNYLFVDGHAAQYTLSATLDPANYLWGTNMWSVVNKPVIQNATADNNAPGVTPYQ
jgi:prepilin-type N-terminal cleavage/methylation domain-containing protein/prepilin-type processing-associated H-X9-DG protein